MGQSLHNEQRRFRRLVGAQPNEVVQCRLSLPKSALTRIHAIKQGAHIRTRDAAIAALIRAARTHFEPHDFALPPEPPSCDVMISISLSLEAGHVAFLYALQRRYRGCSLGATLEAVVDTVRNLEPRAVQLDLFADTPAVSGPAERW